MQVNAEPAYILHKRPYRESSQILDVFSRNHGRLALMAKGSRGPRAKASGILQPFRPLLLSWVGRGEMPTLTTVDIAEARPPDLRGKASISAMYLNELLVILLHRGDVHEVLFAEYHASLRGLSQAPEVEVVLRNFEKVMLEQLGFGLNLTSDADSGEPVKADCYYAYHFEHGPVQCSPGERERQQCPVLAGSSLLAFETGALESARSIAEIKTLMRHVINRHLGHRKLKSRELFRSTLRKA